MEKALELLEKYVQWVALGIGALVLLFMGYSYVLLDPVTVKLGGETLRPGEVAAAIAADPHTKELTAAVKPNKTSVEWPVIPSGQLAVGPLFSKPEIPSLGAGPVGGPGPVVDVQPTVAGNYKLPILPAAAVVDNMIGRALLEWTRLVPPPPTAVATPVAPAIAVAPAQVEMRDVDYISLLFKLDLVEMEKAMETAGIRPDDLQVAGRWQFLAVEIHRQKKLPSGEWDPTESIISVLPPYQGIMLDLPAPKDTDDGKRYAFLDWAAQNVRTIIQPPFPQAVRGQPWYEPGQPPAQSIDTPLNNGQFGGGISPAGVRLPPNAGGQHMPLPPGAGGGNNFAPRQQPFVSPPGSPPYRLPPNAMPGGSPAYRLPPNATPGGLPFNGGVVGGGAGGTIPGEGSPDGQFNPAQFTLAAVAGGVPAEVKIYAHDITALAAKTYRYRIRYYVRNPFWKASQTISPALTGVFALESPYSEWSKPVTIPPRIEIFAKDVPKPTTGLPVIANFDVFVSKDNNWEHKVLAVSPGDTIGTKDWNSGWSLVDVRKSKSGKYYMILVDANGIVSRRDPETDTNSDRFQTLNGVPAAVPGVTPAILPGPAVGPGRLPRGGGRVPLPPARPPS